VAAPDVRPGKIRRGFVARSVLGFALVAGLLTATAASDPSGIVLGTSRTTPVYDPPVLAGQWASAWCSGGVYARHGTTVVLTGAGHCAREGDQAIALDGRTVLGVFGPPARSATCSHPDRECAGSDLDYVILAPDHIPWGHLNEVDMGAGGYRVLAVGTRALACEDIAVGDLAEFDGRNTFRAGRVIDKGEFLSPNDGMYFPCIVVAEIRGIPLDSGGIVLVNGMPGGVASREFGPEWYLGFTPLPLGLAELGLELCTMPDCGLERPAPAGG